MPRVLEHLEPKAVFHFFEDLTRIPHGSRNTKAISDYCAAFARARGLWVYQDELNNVIIKKPASAGYETAPAVILQGHLDMVAEKTPESPIDMTKDALDLQVEGDYVSAKGTTLGGHSGQEINKGRANANILLGRVLDALVQKLPVRLVSAAGGRKDNAIPNAAEAVLALAEGDLPAAKQIAADCTADLRKEYAVADPGVTVTLEKAAVCPQALTEEATLRVVRYLLLVPNGIAAMSMDIPGLVQTSCNLGIFHVADGVLTAVSSVRSSVASQKQMLLARFAALSQLLGGSLQVTGAYPAWEYRRESVLREKMAAVYEQQTGKAPKIEAIHAGLECGLFAGQLPGLDCVSFGPDLVDIHTAREKMSISSVQRTWKFLLGVLEALKD